MTTPLSATLSRVGRGCVYDPTSVGVAVALVIFGACEPQSEVWTVPNFGADLLPFESVTTTLNW